MKILIPTVEQLNNMNIKEAYNFAFTDFAKATDHSEDGFWVAPSKLSNGLPIICENEYDRKVQDSRIISGIRPIVQFDDIKNCCKKKSMVPGGFTVLCGMFPQTIASDQEIEVLEMFDSIGQTDKSQKIVINNHTYFVYKTLNGNQVYVRHDKKYYKMESIEWVVDNKTNLAITKNVLFNSIYGPTNNPVDSIANQFLNTSFASQFLKEVNLSPAQASSTKKSKVVGAYDFVSKRVDEDSLIEACVLADVPVFLHGKSSDGKSARVKAIDPDCEIIYLRTATPETLCGKSAYDTTNGNVIDIKPSWLKRIERKCEEYPDRIHILFLDEITNALHSIQGMAFNIVLDKEVNGIWKLPDNVRIVAAGNEAEESMAANTLVEPLFNRFAHVYIKTTAKSWLQWAISPMKEKYLDYVKQPRNKRIHPAIVTYIQANGNEVLRTKFTGQEPNADPRKWEIASRLLYSTKNPQTLRCLIGKALAVNFDAFCKNLNTYITVKDVVESTKAALDFELDVKNNVVDTGTKYAVVVALSQCNCDELSIVRQFVSNIAKEFLVVFDAMWTQLNPDDADALLAIK